MDRWYAPRSGVETGHETGDAGARATLGAVKDASESVSAGGDLHEEGAVTTILYAGLDHVQVAAPPGCEGEARAFYGTVLGLPELPKPVEMAKRGGCWFQCGAQQIHIGAEAEFRAAKKAHPAIRLADRASFAALAERLRAAGYEVKRDREMEPEVERFFSNDPWGNRLEMVLVVG
ncbi:Hypothetical protein A7982_09636 [Minicystis rosea]|nr:Hypothetical protein A7982_09636 [Minicystis rosea]